MSYVVCLECDNRACVTGHVFGRPSESLRHVVERAQVNGWTVHEGHHYCELHAPTNVPNPHSEVW